MSVVTLLSTGGNIADTVALEVAVLLYDYLDVTVTDCHLVNLLRQINFFNLLPAAQNNPALCIRATGLEFVLMHLILVGCG